MGPAWVGLGKGMHEHSMVSASDLTGIQGKASRCGDKTG